MKFSTVIGLALATAVSAIALPSVAQSRANIGDLQQMAPGVTVSGRVTSVVGNEFMLEDDSGQIIVDAGPRWWQTVDVSVGEELTVTGEVERGGELDAFSITKGDGTIINIRPAEGPPPWAGGPNRRGAQPLPPR